MNFKKVDELAAQLKQKRPLNDTELKRLREEFIIENTYNSNAIEGNTLTLRETALVLEGVTIGEKPLKDHLEAIGHKEAFDYILELAERDMPLSEYITKEVHSLVLMGDRLNAGIYRSVPVKIVGAVHTPPQPQLVPEKLQEAIFEFYSMKAKRHIIEAIAYFHLNFEGVHPFIDGNGRTGRLLLNLELIKAGLLPINIKYSDSRRYYECFDSYYGEAHSAEPMIELITEYEVEELKKRLDIIK